MATFTSWSAVHSAMLNAAADFFSGKLQYVRYSVSDGGNNRQLEYRSVAEFTAGLEFVAAMAAREGGRGCLRTSAAPRRN